MVLPVRGEENGRAEQDLFTSRVRPILARHCFKCHGPDDKARKAKLRLDVRDRGGETRGFGSRSHRPGQARRERAGQPDLRRRRERTDAAAPRPSSRSPSQTSRFSSSGSPTEPSTRPTGPSSRRDRGSRRTSASANWPRNAIDAFILARLEAAGLQPSEPADRATLIRRVSLDLIGLPPTPEEVEAFLQDQSPDAYETARRPAAGLPPLRRALGQAMARPGPLCRHQRLRERPHPLDLALPRLGDRGLERRHALRPVHRRAARRRPAARQPRPASGSPPAFIATRCSTRKAESTRWNSASTP